METPVKPVMDIAPPAKSSDASAGSVPGQQAAAQQTQSAQQAQQKPQGRQAAAPAAPGAVRPAPAMSPAEEKQAATGPSAGRSNDDTSKAKSAPPVRPPKASTFPTSIVALTVVAMLTLAGLAIAVYSTSAK